MLTELFTNICEFYELFTKFSRICPKTFLFCFFLLPCRTEISGPNNFQIVPKLFLNYEFLVSPNRTRIIHLLLCVLQIIGRQIATRISTSPGPQKMRFFKPQQQTEKAIDSLRHFFYQKKASTITLTNHAI